MSAAQRSAYFKRLFSNLCSYLVHYWINLLLRYRKKTLVELGGGDEGSQVDSF